MLAGSKILPINVEVDTSHVTVGDSDVLSTSLQISNTLVHNDHHPRTRNSQFRNPKKISSRSPDLIVLSDAGQSPVYGLEDDSSPGVTTDCDSEDPYCDTESPTPTNSAVNVDPKNYWHGAEEHRELLATEGEEDDDDDQEADDEKNEIELVDIDNSDSDVGTSANPSSESDADNNSYTNEVEDIDEEEVLKISSDQLDYYKTQFKTLQADPNGLIGGSQAKAFFEKSRLPIAELSHIWQLSDVTKDGALSLNEFCTAMHLVVLRRNNIALPKQLPASLDPLSMVTTQQETEDQLVEPAGTSQHWTKFVDSPTGSIASPGPQPVNFDFKRAQVEQDPRILHPVALRVTPESQSVDLSSSSCPVSLPPVTTSNTLNNPLTNILTTPGGKKEPPPPPPPRPYRGHNRSSSLDLNQLGGRSLNPTAPPPAVPPRVSPNMSSPRKDNEVSQGSTGAFQVYRRPVAATNSLPNAVEKKPAKGLSSVIEDHRRRREVLRKQQHMLAKQLLDIQEEKTRLELRLQKMHISNF